MRKLYIFIILIASICTSCDSVFDYDADDRYDYDSIFDDYSKAGRYLNTCYASIVDYTRWSGCGTFIAVMTDEAHDGFNTRPLNYYADEVSASNEIIMPGHYTTLYTGIRHCNVFLERIDDVERFNIESYRSRWKGEAYMIRAHLFWMLIKRYGPMPIVKETLDLEYDYSQMYKPTFQECVQAVLDDIDLGMAEEEVLWRTEDSLQSESMTHSIGYATKCQITLFSASPLWNEDNDKDLWKEALDTAHEAIENLEEHQFTIHNPTSTSVTGATAYQDVFFSSMYGLQNLETIYQLKSRLTVWDVYGSPVMKESGVSASGISPVQELVDAYETTDGEPILNLEQPYLDANHLIPNYNPAALVSNGGLYDPENPYENRDMRLKSSIICNGDYYNPVTETNQIFTYAGGNSGIDASNSLYTTSGYYLRKFINWNSTTSSGQDGYWCHYRMAEMYLNRAEAELEYYGEATAQAYEDVNKVRARAGQPDLPAGLSYDEFKLRLRNERRVELAFEEHRYFDLRRWKINQDYEGLVTRMDITYAGTDTYKYTRAVLSERAVTDDKYRLWPVPIAEENMMRTYGFEIQNPGW